MSTVPGAHAAAARRTNSGWGEFGADERARMAGELETKLPAEMISTRPGQGGKSFSYMESWRCIEAANRIFGFDGWSSSVEDLTQEYLETHPGNKISVGFSAIIRVTLRSGATHEDVGFGSSDKQPDRGKAIENAKKEAVSDGLKRALRSFGHALGLSIYDTQHVKDVKDASKNAAAKRQRLGCEQSAQRAPPRGAAPAATPTGLHAPPGVLGPSNGLDRPPVSAPAQHACAMSAAHAHAPPQPPATAAASASAHRQPPPGVPANGYFDGAWLQAAHGAAPGFGHPAHACGGTRMPPPHAQPPPSSGPAPGCAGGAANGACTGHGATARAAAACCQQAYAQSLQQDGYADMPPPEARAPLQTAAPTPLQRDPSGGGNANGSPQMWLPGANPCHSCVSSVPSVSGVPLGPGGSGSPPVQHAAHLQMGQQPGAMPPRGGGGDMSVGANANHHAPYGSGR